MIKSRILIFALLINSLMSAHDSFAGSPRAARVYPGLGFAAAEDLAVTGVEPSGPVGLAGLKVGDRIVAIQVVRAAGLTVPVSVKNLDDVGAAIDAAKGDGVSGIVIFVIRKGGKPVASIHVKSEDIR